MKQLKADAALAKDYARFHKANGDTLLHSAIDFQRVAVVQALLDAGADANTPGEFGRLPLFAAISKGNRELVTLLLDKGARLDGKNAQGETPLQWAATVKKDDIAALLRERGAK